MRTTRDCLIIQQGKQHRRILGSVRGVDLSTSELADLTARRLHVPASELAILETIIPRIPEPPSITDDTAFLLRQYRAYQMLDEIDVDEDLRAFFDIARRLIIREALPEYEARTILRYMDREDDFEAEWTGEREQEEEAGAEDENEGVNEDGDQGGFP